MTDKNSLAEMSELLMRQKTEAEVKELRQLLAITLAFIEEFSDGVFEMIRPCAGHTSERSHIMQGLYKEYIVTKADGSLTDDEAQYFVLRIDTDPHARLALWAYSASVLHENPKLALELIKWLYDTLNKFHDPSGSEKDVQERSQQAEHG